MSVPVVTVNCRIVSAAPRPAGCSSPEIGVASGTRTCYLRRTVGQHFWGCTPRRQSFPTEPPVGLLAAIGLSGSPSPWVSFSMDARSAMNDGNETSVDVPETIDLRAHPGCCGDDRQMPAEVPRRGFFRRMGGFWFGSLLATGFTTLAVTHLMWLLGIVRFMFPNVLIEAPTKFKVGVADDYADGQVDSRYKAEFGVWIVRHAYEGRPQIYALRAVCTHLGCTPNWLEAEQKFKCPCHGSGFYKDGDQLRGSGTSPARTIRDPHRRRRPVGSRQEPEVPGRVGPVAGSGLLRRSVTERFAGRTPR